MGLDDLMFAIHKRDGNGCTPLDCALRFASSGIASKLLDAGCEPTKPYIIEDCGIKLAVILQTLRPSDPYRRSEEVLRTKTPSQAAGEGDLETLETYQLRDEDLNEQTPPNEPRTNPERTPNEPRTTLPAGLLLP